MRNRFILGSSLVLLLTAIVTYLWPPFGWAFAILIPLIAVGLYDVFQTRHTILRNYPIVGHGRYLLESIRPEIQQYFVELDTAETPISRDGLRGGAGENWLIAVHPSLLGFAFQHLGNELRITEQDGRARDEQRSSYGRVFS